MKNFIFQFLPASVRVALYTEALGSLQNYSAALAEVRLFPRQRVFPYKRRNKMRVQRQALRRSKHDRLIAGVCGGLGEFFGVSPFWFRLAMFIAFIPGGVPGILIYLLAMIVIPAE